VLGGLVSSASAVASAGSLSAADTLSPNVEAIGALLASIASRDQPAHGGARGARRPVPRRVAAVLATLIIAAALGVGVQLLVTRLAM
jgi:hypothetical protein